MHENLSHLSLDERDKHYVATDCVPTTCAQASGLPRVQILRRDNALKPFERVLDLGCHDGFSTRWLLSEPYIQKLVGIDLCTESIAQAKMLCREKAFPELAQYLWGSFFRYEPDEPFDCVCGFEIIEHFLEDEARLLLRKMMDFAIEGGRLYISTPHEDGRWGRSNPDPQHLLFFSPAKLAFWIKEETGVEPHIEVLADTIHARWEKP